MSEKKQRPVSSVPQAGEPSLASLLPSLTEPSLEQMGGRAPGEDAVKAAANLPIPGTPAKVNPLKGAVKVQGDF
jgi:hypothetical protein